VGCNTLPGERYGKLKRVHNRFNAEVNGYFLCDRGRFGAGFVNLDSRLDYPAVRREDGRFDAVEHRRAMQYMLKACSQGNIAGIGSPRASVESNYLLRTLVGAESFCPGFSTAEQALVNLALQLQQNTRAIIPDIQTIESADAVVILGEDLTNTAPRIALALRQSVRNKAYTMAAKLGLQPWQDAAVRNLAQDQRSPLFIASVADTRLDDVAMNTLQLAPGDIARLGRTIAAAILGQVTEALDGPLQAQADAIAEVLNAAQRPLIVSGTGCGSAEVMAAAADIANALSEGSNRAMLSMAVPEANSLGQAMLAGPAAPTIAELSSRAAAGELECLVVMENDLYRRGPEQDISQLLERVPSVIVIDALQTRTMSACSLALPAASFVESEGTLVSMEGRAQRHFPVYPPTTERRGSWTWLLIALKDLERTEVAHLHLFDHVTQACATEIPALAGITAAAPDGQFRNVGLKVPRQTHRYSGRTAMRANISVHEPKQPVDEESSLAYSMEGLNRSQPGSLLPFVWSPGWNSNQSLHKFQAEVGGPLAGGTAGTRLLLPSAKSDIFAASEASSNTVVPDGHWLLVPRQRIFGSDELSALSPAIAELLQPATIEISSTDAAKLQVVEGDGLAVGNGLATLEVCINDSLASGCAAYSAGVDGTFNLCAGEQVTLLKATSWQRHKPQLIGSDGGGHV
jgi:NADH-quinone oxidoreductase subunit G